MEKSRVLVYNPYKISSVLAAANLLYQLHDDIDEAVTLTTFEGMMEEDKIGELVWWVGLKPTTHKGDYIHTHCDDQTGMLTDIHRSTDKEPRFEPVSQLCKVVERYENLGTVDIAELAVLLVNQQQAIDYLHSYTPGPDQHFGFVLDVPKEERKQLYALIRDVKTSVTEKARVYKTKIKGKKCNVPVISADPFHAPWYARRLGIGYSNVVTYEDVGGRVLIQTWSKDGQQFDARELVRNHLTELATSMLCLNNE